MPGGQGGVRLIWEFVLSESDGGTHLVQRTAWHTALVFAVLASRLAPPATNTSRESPQPRAHQGQPGRRRACIHAWSGTLEMTASAVSPLFDMRVEEVLFWVAIVVGFVVPFPRSWSCVSPSGTRARSLRPRLTGLGEVSSR